MFILTALLVSSFVALQHGFDHWVEAEQGLNFVRVCGLIIRDVKFVSLVARWSFEWGARSMGHVTRETNWCSIDIDTALGRVFLQERWQYQWLVAAGQTAWTLEQKRNFHNRADRAIWAAWSNRIKLRAAGASPFATRFNHRDIPINVDIRWVTARPHWNVNVTKIAPGAFATSSVQWTARIITLDSNDTNLRTFTGAAAGRPTTTQMPVAHEFGHALGNTSVLGRGDEYVAGSTNVADNASIMNVGHGLRVRHFRTIIGELDQMIPGTTFSVRSV